MILPVGGEVDHPGAIGLVVIDGGPNPRHLGDPGKRRTSGIVLVVQIFEICEEHTASRVVDEDMTLSALDCACALHEFVDRPVLGN